MIKVSVMYPNKEGARFDHKYYREKHMPLVKARMGDACKYYTIDRGLATSGRGKSPLGMDQIARAAGASDSPREERRRKKARRPTTPLPRSQTLGGSGTDGAPISTWKSVPL